ncbi:MAG: GNAT family N-acetyltransferase [Oscillospiraceae bacterium]|nr:GNAT family N-acetyltransferase [Oscillospiraceae bacterium]
MQIETKRLLLRPFADGDAADLYAYAKDPQVGPSAGWPPHKSEAESLEIIRTVFPAESSTFAVVLKETGRVVGSCGFVGRSYPELPRPSDEIGYALSSAWWGQGLIPEAVQTLLEYGFGEMGLETIWCSHYAGNEKSKRVIEKNHFFYRFCREEDVPLMGERRMTFFYALTKSEWLDLQRRPMQ